MEEQSKDVIHLWQRKGLLIGLICNSILTVKALLYLFLPVGSAVPIDSVLYSSTIYGLLYLLLFLVCVMLGLPLAIQDAFKHRKRRGNDLLSTLGIALCLMPFFTPYLLRKTVFDARQLRTPCIICYGGDSTEGYSLIPPDSREARTFPLRYVAK